MYPPDEGQVAKAAFAITVNGINSNLRPRIEDIKLISISQKGEYQCQYEDAAVIYGGVVSLEAGGTARVIYLVWVRGSWIEGSGKISQINWGTREIRDVQVLYAGISLPAS